MRMKQWMHALVLALGSPLAPAQVAATDAVGLRGDLGGLWFDPGNRGQGLQIDVVDGGRAVVTWYTFDSVGNPLWLAGDGRVDGQAIVAGVASASGGRFPAAAPMPATLQRRGEVRIEFAGCERAQLRYRDDPDSTAGLGQATVDLVRLTAPAGSRCNGEEEFDQLRSFSFERGHQDFAAVFADLPVAGQDIYELDYRHEALPAPLQARRGLRLTGHNRSDDLAMLVKAPLRGLRPHTLYRLELELEFASDVPAGCIGVGGSPGEGVYMKLGASTIEPLAVATDEGGVATLRLNIDYGVQSNSGAAARVVGDFSNSQDCEAAQAMWELQTLSTRGQELRARSDSNGDLWVLAGTDSAFEGLTIAYFTALRVRLAAVDEG